MSLSENKFEDIIEEFDGVRKNNAKIIFVILILFIISDSLFF
jgi:hypothetical protein